MSIKRLFTPSFVGLLSFVEWDVNQICAVVREFISECVCGD